MARIKEFLKHKPALIGWLTAAILAALGIVCAVIYYSRPLSLMLYVNGNEVCCVENQSSADEALRIVNEKMSCVGGFGDHKIDYKLIRGSRDAVSTEKCSDLLYEISASDFNRAYGVYAGNTRLGFCSTYFEAEKLISEFSSYVKDRVINTESDEIGIEITTELTIKNVMCSPSEIKSADEIFTSITDELPSEYGDNKSDSQTGDINAPSSNQGQAQPPFGSLVQNNDKKVFNFMVSNTFATVSYNTIRREKYSEIIPFETEYVETDLLFAGETEIVVEGKNGIADCVYDVSYFGETEISRKPVSSVTLSKPVKQIVRIGTKPYPTTDPTGIFTWPVVGRKIITTYHGEYTSDGGKYDAHNGLDIAGNAIGTSVCAADGGLVTFAGDNGNYGLTVIIRHEDGIVTVYSHIRALRVTAGQKVYKGQQIAEVGMTGVTTGPHVHFEVQINETSVNPLDYLPM